jgi:hypothetical protein
MIYQHQYNEPEYAIYIKVQEHHAPHEMCIRSIKISTIFPNVHEAYEYFQTHKQVMYNWVEMLRDVGYTVYGIEIMILV